MYVISLKMLTTISQTNMQAHTLYLMYVLVLKSIVSGLVSVVSIFKISIGLDYMALATLGLKS